MRSVLAQSPFGGMHRISQDATGETAGPGELESAVQQLLQDGPLREELPIEIPLQNL